MPARAAVAVANERAVLLESSADARENWAPGETVTEGR
jgi:hypothetical protein